jgi:F-type H+-transporting ATPase subunit gamma
VLGRIVVRADASGPSLLARREARRIDLLVIASDRGLCGGFNANVLRKAEAFLLEREPRGLSVSVSVVGRKAREYFRRRRREMRRVTADLRREPNMALAAEIGDDLIARYVNEETDEVWILYSEFRSAISQRPTLQRILPLGGQPDGAAEAESALEYKYEPSADALLQDLLPRTVHVQVLRGLLESAAGEHGARMTAMDSATNNASDMIDRLTLLYNRARQASITKELVEIVSGAEALK